MKDKIKSFLNNKDILIVLLIILVGTASFGLGRLSAKGESKSPVRIVSNSENSSAGKATLANVSNSANSSNLSSAKVVASKNGSKYHFPWCPGASQISDKNKIWFDSGAAAEAAGYERASNCRGL